MRRAILLFIVMFIVGCNSQSGKPSASTANLAIDNLSRMSEQLDSIGREKDLFADTFDDFETQQAVYSPLFDCNHPQSDAPLAFQTWHGDIQRRETALQRQHALNVLIAHIKAEQIPSCSSDPPTKQSHSD